MRCPTTGCRSLFFLTAALAAVFVTVSIANTRKLHAVRQENERLNEVNPFAISLQRTRDREHRFTVENYGYLYTGMTGSLIDDSVLVFGAWEKFMLFFLEDYVRAAGLRDTAFLDVGANTGQHSLFMATRVKEVHAFDPYPPVLKLLHENVALNKFANVRVHEVGLGDREASLPFYGPGEDNHGGGTFRPDEDKKPIGQLRIVAGDEYLRGVPAAPVGLIKVDIEGYEESALRGLRGTIGQHRPLVVVEVSPPPHGTIASLDQLRALFPENYEFLAFQENQRQYVTGNYELVDFAPIADRFFKTEHHRNLVAVPAEKLSLVPRRREGK
jgi:FkbM family methyltransferase